MKYLNSIPKPLLEDFLNGRVIPFVGSGFSKNADIPEGVTMPDWKELGKLAADNIPGYVFDGNSIDALSYYEELYSRPKLVEFIINKTGWGKINPSKVHETFCNLFTGTICTTNFDNLIENELALLKRPFSTIVTEDRLLVKSVNECRVVKVHGDCEHPNKMVITESDFDRYLSENPIMATYIANLFISNTMLLVGYSLDDNDLRGILQIINDRLGKMTLPVYCITLNATQEKIDRFKRRNIRVINFVNSKISYRDFFIGLFSEIKEYVEDKRKKSMTSTDDEISAQLVIPPTENNLCFLSCIYRRSSRISKIIKPILESVGMALVELNDVSIQGKTIADTLTTLIGKCNTAIVDITKYSIAQVYAIHQLMDVPTKNIIFICEGQVDESYKNIVGKRKVLRYFGDDPQNENFTTQLRDELLKNRRNNVGFSSKRLFQKKEYPASVSMAYSEIESYSKKVYQSYVSKFANTPSDKLSSLGIYSFSRFVNDMLKLTQEEQDAFRYFTIKRNRIVHFNEEINESEAKECLEIAEMIYKKLKEFV